MEPRRAPARLRAAGPLSAQLPLRLWDAAQSFERFVLVDANRALLRRLREVPAQGGGCYLHGAPGSGRSHLLHAACQVVDGPVACLELGQLAGQPPAAVLEGLECCRLVCVDDLQQVAGDADWERELFHLLNRVQRARGGWLVAADGPPGALGLCLPDLVSRLAAGGVYRLAPLGEAGLRVALRREAALRGLALDDAVVQYIVTHAGRDMPGLIRLLDSVSALVTGSGRALSVPLVRKALHAR